MPSIRILQHRSYTSPHAVSDTGHFSPSPLTDPFSNQASPGGSTPPETVPSLPALRNRDELPEHRPRLSMGLSRVQSRIFRDSSRNFRASTYHGPPNVQDSAINPAQTHRHPPPRVLTKELSSQQPRTASDSAAVHGINGQWTKDQHHHDDIVEHLDVIDPQVGAVSTLTNAANSIIIPPTPLWERKPVIELPVQRIDEETRESVYGDALDWHVDNVFRCPSPIRRALLGVLSFLKTPMGIITGIYGFLVVFWGAAIVIFLARIINLHNDNLQGFWVEVSSQVVNGLFTVTGIGLIPSRVVATYRIYKIWNYKRKTIHLRKIAGLPQLFDPDDLPDPLYNDNYVRVLIDEEQQDLHRQQVKFQYHQTWYRAHGSETHRAFPINTALAICFLTDGNSVFQIMLCGTMWGLDRFQRPAWSTATLITASFLCGIGAVILIWRGGKKTKRVEEIRQKLRHALAETPHPTDEIPSEPLPINTTPGRGGTDNSPNERPELIEAINSSSEKLTVGNRGRVL